MRAGWSCSPRRGSGFREKSSSITPEQRGRGRGRTEEVTDVIVTHAHWDHAGGVELFSKARIWIQREELEYYAGTAWQGARTHGRSDRRDRHTRSVGPCGRGGAVLQGADLDSERRARVLRRNSVAGGADARKK